jgi:hypothetical protein
MKRFKEFEEKLLDRISRIEGTEVKAEELNKYLTGDGQIRCSYTSLIHGCEITGFYKGIKSYGPNGKINLNLELSYLIEA